MTGPANWAEGVLVLGPGSACCAGSGAVVLDNAMLVVDPAAPDLLASLRVYPATAANALDQLFVVDDLSSDAGGHILALGRLDGRVRPAPRLLGLLQLGVVDWLEEHSPDPLSPFWLDLEVACRTADASDLVDPGEVVVERLTGRIDQMLDAVDRPLARSDAGVPRAVRSLLRQSLVLAAEILPRSDPRLPELTRALEREARAAREREPAWSPATAPLNRAAETRERSLRSATHAGGPSREGVSSVDWSQTGRGVLDPAESTVHWAVDPTAGEVRVEVLAGWAATGRDELAFRALTAEGSLVGVGALSLDPRRGFFAGVGRVDLTSRIDLVDVFDPRVVRPPRVGPAAVAAEALRAAVRAVTLVRLARGQGLPELAGPALDLLQRAARLHGVVGADGARSDGDRVVPDRQIQCLQLTQLVAGLTGARDTQGRVSSTLRRHGVTPLPAPGEVVLTAAEAAFLGGLREPG